MLESDVIRTPDERFDPLVGFPFAPNYSLAPNPENDSTPLRTHYIDEHYKQGICPFPARIPIAGGDVAAAINEASWEALSSFARPFLALFGDADPGKGGREATLQERIPGAKGQPYETLERAVHLVQEDCGEEVAEKVVAAMVRTSP